MERSHFEERKMILELLRAEERRQHAMEQSLSTPRRSPFASSATPRRFIPALSGFDPGASTARFVSRHHSMTSRMSTTPPASVRRSAPRNSVQYEAYQAAGLGLAAGCSESSRTSPEETSGGEHATDPQQGSQTSPEAAPGKHSDPLQGSHTPPEETPSKHIIDPQGSHTPPEETPGEHTVPQQKDSHTSAKDTPIKYTDPQQSQVEEHLLSNPWSPSQEEIDRSDLNEPEPEPSESTPDWHPSPHLAGEAAFDDNSDCLVRVCDTTDMSNCTATPSNAHGLGGPPIGGMASGGGEEAPRGTTPHCCPSPGGAAVVGEESTRDLPDTTADDPLDHFMQTMPFPSPIPRVDGDASTVSCQDESRVARALSFTSPNPRTAVRSPPPQPRATATPRQPPDLPNTPRSKGQKAASPSQLLRLIRQCDGAEETRSLKNLFARRFTILADEGEAKDGVLPAVDCLFEKQGGDDEGETSRDSSLCVDSIGCFTSLPNVSDLLNVCDVMVCRLVAQRSALPLQGDIVRVALAATRQGLKTIEEELAYTQHRDAPDNEREEGEPADCSLPFRELSHLAQGRVAEALRCVEERIGRKGEGLCEQTMTPAVEALRQAVTATLSSNLPSFPGVDAHDLNDTITSLKHDEECERRRGNLQACADLRQQQLKERKDWLVRAIGQVAKHKQVIEECHRTAMRPVEEAVGTIGDLKQRMMDRRAHLSAKVSSLVQQVGGLRTALSELSAQDRAEGEEVEQKVEANTVRIERVLETIEAAYKEMESLFLQRTELVKNRVLRKGGSAVKTCLAEQRLREKEKSLQALEKKMMCYQETHDALLSSMAVLEAAGAEWTRGMMSRGALEESATEQARAAIEQVWGEHIAAHRESVGLVDRTILSHGRKLQYLDGVIREAEERYDAWDRDHAIAEQKELRTRMVLLHEERERLEEGLRALLSDVKDFFGEGTPSRAGGPDDASSPPEPSPGCDESPVAHRNTMLWRSPVVDVVRELRKPDRVAQRWVDKIEATDVTTMADLAYVRGVPSLWQNFLVDQPMLKAELEALLAKVGEPPDGVPSA